jgi:F1F0 ATPase subunit 2
MIETLRHEHDVACGVPGMTVGGLLFAAIGGGVLAAIFLLGLRLAVDRVPHVAHPALWLIASFVLRMLCVLGGFYVIAVAAGRAGLFTALATFLLTRSAWLAHARREPRAAGKH